MVEEGPGEESAVDDLEGGVVGVTGAGDEGVGEAVVGVLVGGGQGADDRAGGRVLGDRGRSEGDVGGGGAGFECHRDGVGGERERHPAHRGVEDDEPGVIGDECPPPIAGEGDAPRGNPAQTADEPRSGEIGQVHDLRAVFQHPDVRVTLVRGERDRHKTTGDHTAGDQTAVVPGKDSQLLRRRRRGDVENDQVA